MEDSRVMLVFLLLYFSFQGTFLGTQSLDSFPYILSIYPFLFPLLMYNVSYVSYNRMYERTYSIIHPYFALVQGISH